ncbi:hypothetical protein GCM10010302_10940 [Streptomyces polychromogenes]|uniref:Ricin B lectin domain-containing protein n=1 Tax=Streptomyces polychromogenes TaxID=67342 RepID=A0ABP3EUW6_9ACTN
MAESSLRTAGKATGGCLRVWNNGAIDTGAGAVARCGMAGPLDGKHASTIWNDSQNNIKENTNNQFWKITTNVSGFSNGYCLSSWYQGQDGLGNVYIEPCGSPANVNQQWVENWTGDGMQIVSRLTGLCLDSNREGRVYTHACNGSDYQVWK